MRIDLGRFRRGLIVAALVCASVSTGATAESELIDVTIDFAKVVRLSRPAHTIFIGNPGIADASVDDEQTLVLTGRTAGRTNLIVLDADGEEILNSAVNVASNTSQLTTIFFGANRQTFSCAPVCEQVISVGDEPTSFTNASTQIQGRKDFSAPQ